MSTEKEDKFLAIQFVFEEEEEAAVKEKSKLKKSAKVKNKNHNYVMKTISGEEIKVEESKTYSVKIIRAYVNEGIEYCSMVIQGFESEECSWVPYKKFRFI
jgi:hypothetical protein